jgi:two-component sensor histidine kinase
MQFAAADRPSALALHELATNTNKYGALWWAGRQVALLWRAGAAVGLLCVFWAETGGSA